MSHTVDWTNPLTAATYAMPARLAARLDELVADLPAGYDFSSQALNQYHAIRDQVAHLLSVYAGRRTYRRLRDELHAADEELLPIGPQRYHELRAAVSTTAVLRDLKVAYAIHDGVDAHDAALAAGISFDEALTAAANTPS